jgi:hypothetical protein
MLYACMGTHHCVWQPRDGLVSSVTARMMRATCGCWDSEEASVPDGARGKDGMEGNSEGGNKVVMPGRQIERYS